MSTTSIDVRTEARAIRPRAFTLELTKGCNLRCGYCYYAQREAAYDPKTAMTEEVAEQSVEVLLKEGPPGEPVHLHFFGGEPLLNFPLLRHTVDYAERRAAEAGREVTFEVTTNGTRFTEEMVAFLNRHRVHVGVSFDGPPDVQDASRPALRGSSHALAEPGIRSFLASRRGGDLESVTHASVVVTRREPDLVRIVRHLEDLGFRKIILSPATDLKGENHGFRVEDLPVVLAAYDALARDHEERRRQGRTPPDTWFGGLLQQLLSGRRKTQFCEGGRDYLGVAADGQVYLCYRFYEEKDFRMGSVQEGIDRAVTERLLELPVESKPACSTCWARHFCGGGCHHENLISTGGLGEPNPVTCEILRHSMDLTLEMWARLSRDGVLPARGAPPAEGSVMSQGTPPIGDGDRPTRKAGCHVRNLDDGHGRAERIVYDPESHEVVILNPTAARIFDLCDGQRTVAAILEELRRRYPSVAVETLRRDLESALDELRRRHVVG